MDAGKLVFESRKYVVRRLDVRDPAGSVHEYDIVTHPGAAIILPLLPDGRVVLIRNYRVAVEQELLELPAGTVDPPEPPIECARRELAEETGYRAGRLEPLLSFYSTPGICTEKMDVFLATELTPGRPQHDATEQIRVTPMDLGAALAAIRDRRIVDGKTIAALLYYERFARAQENGR